MLPRIHIVSSCSDGKRGAIAASRRLSSYSQENVDSRFAAWWAAMRDPSAAPSTKAASELYTGDHWAVSRELPGLAGRAGWDARLWTLSAGYGLIPADAHILPYAATFQPGHADSVSGLSGLEQIAANRRWWDLLAAQPGPDTHAPRSLAALVQAEPDACVLLIASPAYLLAIETDLLDAVSRLAASGQLIIVSSSVPHLSSGLEHRRVASNARLRSIVQGSMVSLHARVARWLIQTAAEHHFELAAVKDKVATASRELPPPPKYERRPATDEEVRMFLRSRMRAEPKTSHTRLLRAWRSAGHACEQSRFRELFREVQEAKP